MNMALRSLRPVGNRVSWSTDAEASKLEDFTESYRVLYLSSGTAALALALELTRKRAAVANPEVVLPAYGCPDLVAAAVHAGVRPVLADLSPDSAAYDLESVSAALSPQTVAIVAVTLLGIRPNFGALRSAMAGRNIALIEDSAQWFPRDSTQRFVGDLVVLSFGRGKPVNVLGGGALLVDDGLEVPSVPVAPSDAGAVKDAAKVAIYNALIRPLLYGFAERLPFLGIGLTRYHALDEITAVPPGCKARLPANLRRYVSRNLDVQAQWRSALATLDNVLDLPATHGVPSSFALLRYPILMSSKAVRDKVYQELKRAGLGASTMYAQSLPDIDGVHSLVTMRTQIPCARNFADRLITLPTHDDVDDAVIKRTVDILRRRSQQ